MKVLPLPKHYSGILIANKTECFVVYKNAGINVREALDKCLDRHGTSTHCSTYIALINIL